MSVQVRAKSSANSTRVILRAACFEDQQSLILLLHDTFRTTWAFEVSIEAQRLWFEEDRAGAYVRSMSDEFIVAEQDGEVAGMVHWREAFIHALHVHSRFQRRGIGGLLLSHAEHGIACSGRSSARLETDSFNGRSRSFYAAHGYREIGSRPDEEWNSGIVTLLPEKQLNSGCEGKEG